MKDKAFIDSNILIYAYSDTEKEKQELARELISGNNSHISTQVIQELADTLNRRFKKPYVEIKNALEESCRNNDLHTNTQNTVLQACDIAEQYKYSFYDSLIISAALEKGCSMLYSEDMQSGQIINGQLKIINPFSISNF
jgi:predicted nucleic acid-binding protein